MNPNIKLSQIFVDRLAQSGLTDVVICPGSRSTPLTLVFDAHPTIQTHLALDERSGAFFALGLGMRTGRSAAIVCTSGTAAANFFPAIIEANMSQVPLIVLTADRPQELRHSGANQTINQVNMFGGHVLWAVDMPLPEQNMPDVAWRNVATTAQRAFSKANGLRKGAVHLNFPFRKPLEGAVDSGQWSVVGEKKFEPPTIPHLPSNNADLLARWFAQYEKGIIVCGPSCPAGDFPRAVTQFAHLSGYPIFADPLSGIRFSTDTAESVIGGYETWLSGGRKPSWEAPDIVIRFGAVPTSKWLNQYLSDIKPNVRLHVRESDVWADDSHLTTDFWQINEASFCQNAAEIAITVSAERRQVPAYGAWQKSVLAWEQENWFKLEAELANSHFDAVYLVDLVNHQSIKRCNLMIGNSLPVRHLDAFCRPAAKKIRVFGNRGASGIDGVVSTACGIAAADPDTPTFLIIGDVSFYHDMNGLLAAKNLPNLTIVLFNNNSGSIFRRLPISNYERPFDELFLTAHDLNFSHTATLYGLDHQRLTDQESFNNGVDQALHSERTHLLELMTDGAQDEAIRKQLISKLFGS
ncbi:MAG: 2-succinyl-5-enolpyruvyl-6-hydroxy-3-cyclohexene-1-carboxylic-acid synthase [Chloroflexota bacterium]